MSVPNCKCVNSSLLVRWRNITWATMTGVQNMSTMLTLVINLTSILQTIFKIAAYLYSCKSSSHNTDAGLWSVIIVTDSGFDFQALLKTNASSPLLQKQPVLLLSLAN